MLSLYTWILGKLADRTKTLGFKKLKYEKQYTAFCAQMLCDKPRIFKSTMYNIQCTMSAHQHSHKHIV